MSIRDILITGKTARLPGDLERHGDEVRKAAELRPTSIGGPGAVVELRIELHEAAIGKPRMTQRDKWKKRPCVMRYREWADRLRTVAGKLPPAERVHSLSWVATFEPPKSWSKKKRVAAVGQLHRAKPDRDNIDKGILDVLYPVNDAGIARGSLEKLWGWEASIVIVILFEQWAVTIA